MAQGKARVHELAAEFGVTAKDILVLLSSWNEFVKSSSSTVEAPLASRVREHYVARPPRPITASDYGASAGPGRLVAGDDNGFGAALETARRQSRRTPAWSHKPGEIETALFRCVIDPVRTKRGNYTPEERDRVERLLRRWLETWLDEMAEWIRVSGGQHPDIAVKLSAAGLMPADADLRIGFGRIDPTRDTIIRRVIQGTLGIKDAVSQVKEYRRSQSATGSD
ncbi:translation initiation factor IF-2 N-terminal domain-containing protein [Mycolicibacterium sp. 120266]|uniref:translation initiation factor IF-2 N-terminal domain-containing protein n=1 Tax=Mycolicibacterium sp. 120266 TaxID=3090601 RepID=UPI0039A44588